MSPISQQGVKLPELVRRAVLQYVVDNVPAQISGRTAT